MKTRWTLLLSLTTVALLHADPSVGSRVGLQVEGLGDTAAALFERNADVNSARLLDYTFASAPTDWQPTGGTWDVYSRFACDPTWSFFGGWSRGLACLWNKRTFAAPLVVEAYVAFKHGLPFNDAKWSYRPSDLCMTFCGDGVNPSSGYQLIWSGDESARTMLRRGETILAQTDDPEALAPSFLDAKPETDDFHRRWWRLEVRLDNGHLVAYVDGHKAVEATDPQPLTSGKLALWTVRNGIMVARVRVASGRELPPARPVLRLAQEAPLDAPADLTRVAAQP